MMSTCQDEHIGIALSLCRWNCGVSLDVGIASNWCSMVSVVRCPFYYNRNRNPINWCKRSKSESKVKWNPSNELSCASDDDEPVCPFVVRSTAQPSHVPIVYTHISIIQLAAMAARHTKTLLLFIYRYSCPTKLFAGINKNQSLLYPHIDAANETSVREMSECERMNNIYFFPMTKLTWAWGMTTWRITEYLK